LPLTVCLGQMPMIETKLKMAVALSCEHGGNFVPDAFRPLFYGDPKVLESHRGWDPGALELFHEMSRADVDYSLFAETTRLLIDINRSLNKRTLFSEYTHPLSSDDKKRIITLYYTPFRTNFRSRLAELIHENSFVLHVSVHSFTPVFKGKVRNADIGLLYDPGFGIEKELADRWRKCISEKMPRLRIRMNYPYLGKNDGHVFALRNYFGSSLYAGIELEVNQKYAFRKDFNRTFSDAFKNFLNDLKSNG